MAAAAPISNKRLAKEASKWANSQDQVGELEVVSENEWIVTFEGAVDTLYAGEVYRLRLQFPKKMSGARRCRWRRSFSRYSACSALLRSRCHPRVMRITFSESGRGARRPPIGTFTTRRPSGWGLMATRVQHVARPAARFRPCPYPSICHLCTRFTVPCPLGTALGQKSIS
mmetsp:Transcript_27211/g.73532  ORF Transcript_27211/g.73532 Transcript_27211/m.73532 type:complete len:171 (-) Transcript_27211:267-779(-)